MTKQIYVEYYTKEELKPKTKSLSDVISGLEEKALDDAVKIEAGVKKEELLDFSDSEFAEVDEVMEAEEADLARDVNLPSNMDSKLWRIKVKPGMERQLVMRLTNKLITHLNNGNPLMVL